MACHYELTVDGTTVKKDEFGLNFLLDNFYHYDGTISDIVFSNAHISERAQLVHDKMESKFGKHRNMDPVLNTNIVDPNIGHSSALEIESEGAEDALSLIARDLPQDASNLGVSDILGLKGITNHDGQPMIPRFEEEKFFENFASEIRNKTISDINKRRFIMEYMGSGHPEDSTEYNEEWERVKQRLSIDDAKRNEVFGQLRLKWYYQKGYGRLLHAIAQKVVRFVETRKGFDASMINDLYKSVKTSDSYAEAMRIETSSNEDTGRMLNDTNMDHLIRTITDGILTSLVDINALEYSGGKHYLKPNVKMYAEIPVKGKTHIPYPDGSPYHGNFTCSGVIDLAVVDSSGRVKIFDWKAGLINGYDEYNGKYQSRRETIAYQLAIYRRLLANTIGIREEDIECSFIGYKHENFRLEKHGSSDPTAFEYVVDNIVPFGGEPYRIDYSSRHMKKIKTIDMYIIKEQPVLELNEDIINEISEFKTKAFGDTRKQFSDDDVTLIIANNGGVYKNKEGLYEVTINDQKFTGTTEEKAKKKAAEYIKTGDDRKGFGSLDHVQSLMNHIKDLQRNGQEYTGQINNTNSTGAIQTYFNDLVNKYVTGPYEIMELDEKLQNAVNKLGMIIFRNTYTGAVDVLHILRSDEIPYKEFTNNNGSYITNKSSYTRNNTDKKLLKNTPGVRNALSDVVALTRIAKENGIEIPINRITCVNEMYNRGEVVTNEQIHYSLNKVLTYSGLQKGLIDDVKLVSKLGVCSNLAQEIVSRISNPMTRKGLTKMSKLKDELLDPIISFAEDDMYIHTTDNDVNNCIAKQILEWINNIEDKKSGYAELMTFAQTLGIQTIDEELYQYLNAAYAKAMGYDFTQDAEYKTVTWSLSTKKGIYFSANNIENAGYFDNATLNTITTAMVSNLQLLRQKLAGYLPDIRLNVNKLADSKGFGKIYERTIGNKSTLYSNLIEKGEDYLNFKNPYDKNNNLTNEEREFLKYALNEINRKRGLTIDDERYFWVPLMQGNKYTADSVSQFMARAKGEFSELLSQGEQSLDNDNGLTVENKQKQSDFWILNSAYAHGDIKMHPDARRLKIKKTKGGVDMYETDIENILIGFLFENERLETLKNVMPIVRAGYAYANNATLYGNLDNKKMKEFIEDYVRVNVHRESIVNESFQKPMKFVNSLKNLVTKFALAFSPVQFTYQMLAGNLKNFELALSKHDVNCNFTASDLMKAKKIVYSCMFTDNGNKTIADLLNEIGGFNAINMKHYTEAVTSNRNGFMHIADRFAMKFAEKPDFYNRVELVIAQMIHDGYFDAVNNIKDGRIHYDFKKDGRFKHIANGDLTSEAAKKELGLYYAMARDMANSNIHYPDGKVFNMPKFGEIVPLPAFWTANQITTLKDVGDLAYGYYDDMNKMMFAHEWFGQLVSHFRTYWPAKKSQWLAQGGVKLRGHYAQKVERITDENGVEKLIKYYYKKDAEGNLTGEITTDENEAYCAYQEWVGDYHEGIVSSIFELVRSTFVDDPNMITLRSLKEKIDKGIATEMERSMYMEKMGNLVQVGYTISIMVIGIICRNLAEDMLKGLKNNDDDDDDKTLTYAMSLDAAVLLQNTIKNATSDFNPIGSLGGPVIDSNPISIGYMANTFKRYISCITGDNDAWDATVKACAGTRQLENTISLLKPQYIIDQKGVLYKGKSIREKEAKERGEI